MPRYEYTAGSSNKFWEIALDGASYTVQYGRIGTVGQTSTKSFADEATAQKKYEAAIRSKTKKGYALVAQAELAAAEAEAEERLVLADKLQEAGDPRGRLISVQNEIVQKSGNERAALRRTETTLLSENAEALLGPFAADDAKACSDVEWSLGFWEKVTLKSDYEHQDVVLADLLRTALAHPSAAHLHQLHLGIPESVWDGMSSWQPMLTALAESGAPELTYLECADHDDNAEISWCEIGDFSGVWAAAPKLEKLEIRGVGVTFGAVSAPELRELSIVSGGLPGEPVRRISEASLPKLEKLEIYLGTDEYGASTTLEDCAGILSGERLPAVTHLALKNGEIMDELTLALATAPITKQLKVLDLGMGTMTDEGAQHLVDHASAFAHLELLDVSQNFLSSEMAAKLRKAVPRTIAHSQKDAHEYGDDEPWYYTSIAE